jgi:hypothetical protein
LLSFTVFLWSLESTLNSRPNSTVSSISLFSNKMHYYKISTPTSFSTPVPSSAGVLRHTTFKSRQSVKFPYNYAAVKTQLICYDNKI